MVIPRYPYLPVPRQSLSAAKLHRKRALLKFFINLKVFHYNSVMLLEEVAVTWRPSPYHSPPHSVTYVSHVERNVCKLHFVKIVVMERGEESKLGGGGMP